MSKTLLLRLAAPMQSWGVASKYTTRDTAMEPSKSGVIGLLAAALGRGRDESIEDLAGLKFGVRADQPGELMRDFHTAKGRTKQGEDRNYVTERYYIADAVFVVALEGEDELIKTLSEAIESPYHALSLGRRSCPPTGRMLLGVLDMGCVEALKTYKWQASEFYREKVLRNYERTKVIPKIKLVYDADRVTKRVQTDVPISFSWKHRQHTKRFIAEEYISLSEICGEIAVEHDPFEGLGGDE